MLDIAENRLITKISILGVLAFIVQLYSPLANAAEFLFLNDHHWFDRADNTYVQAVVDLKGLTPEKVAAELAAQLGGKVMAPSADATGKSILIKGTTIGNLFVNSGSFIRSQPGGIENGIQLTMTPVKHADLVQLNQTLKHLKAIGATGPSAEYPLAARVITDRAGPEFLRAISGLTAETQKDLSAAHLKSKTSGNPPYLFRYFLADPATAKPEQFEDFIADFKGTTVGLLPADTYGRQPLVLPGESVVLHNRDFHRFNVLGKYNPGLSNYLVTRSLGVNKYAEARFWEEYAPGAMPQTELLSNLSAKPTDITELTRALNQKYPNGWVMKGTNESSTGKFLVTNSKNLQQEVADYLKGDFDAYRAKVLVEQAGNDEDFIFEALQQHPNYFGWKVTQYMNNPHSAIVQERVAIDKEFRVEIISGKVLGNGSTMDRYWYHAFENGRDVPKADPKLIHAVEEFAQNLVDRLPPKLRSTSFGFDVAVLKNGKMSLIESNPAVESAFLVDTYQSSQAAHAFLREYPRLVKEGKIHSEGMSGEEQLAYLEERFKKWGLTKERDFPNKIFSTEMVDFGFKRLDPGAAFKRIAGLPLRRPCLTDRLPAAVQTPIR